MKELSIREFLVGHLPAETLDQEIHSSVKKIDPITSEIHIQDMETPFLITRSMAIKLCDAVLSGKLSPQSLQPIAFTLLASDSFYWDDDLLTNVIHDCSAPEINFPLTVENVERFRKWLLNEESYPSKHKQDTLSRHRKQLVSKLVKITV